MATVVVARMASAIYRRSILRTGADRAGASCWPDRRAGRPHWRPGRRARRRTHAAAGGAPGGGARRGTVDDVGPVGLLREIVHDPRRSTVWKLIDVTLIVVLWAGLAVLVVLRLFHDDFDLDPVLYLWIVATVVGSTRAWYLHPRQRRRRSGTDPTGPAA